MPSDNPHKASSLYEVEKLDNPSIQSQEEFVIPLIEEQVKIGKQVVETGRVKISKKIEEREEIVTLPLTEEEITVERKSIEKYVDQAPAVRYEGDTTIYSVIKEVMVVEKKLMLVEEIHVTKRHRTTITNETVKLRTESINVERVTPNNERPG